MDSVAMSKPDNANSPLTNTVFRTIGLTKTYEMGEVKVHALRGIDSELYPGELVVLLGASGSGKSTYMNILGGLDRASTGQVFYRDRELTHASETELTEYRRYHVGFVFQFYNLIPSLTALENVSIVTEIAQNPMRPEAALELVNLGNRMNHFPSELSGGEQQRVAIARAIAKNPAVLLCDEPTGALDSETGVLVLSAIEQINRELNTTTAVITHNVSIGAMADRVIRLSDGLISNTDINQHKVSPREIRW
jgi:putative ABC transport system ATP-binding protein